MSSNSPLIIGGIKLPIDLSPAERAQLKAVSYAVMIAVFNIVLTLIAILDQGKAVSWNTVIISLISQGALALMSTLKKYYSASGDIPTSTLIQLAQNEVLAHAPSVPALSANEQALQQTVGQMFDPGKVVVQSSVSPVASQPVQNSAIPAQVSFQVSQPNPVSNQATSAQSIQQAVQAPVDNHPSLDNVSLSNTLPTIQAIAK